MHSQKTAILELEERHRAMSQSHTKKGAAETPSKDGGGTTPTAMLPTTGGKSIQAFYPPASTTQIRDPALTGLTSTMIHGLVQMMNGPLAHIASLPGIMPANDSIQLNNVQTNGAGATKRLSVTEEMMESCDESGSELSESEQESNVSGDEEEGEVVERDGARPVLPGPVSRASNTQPRFVASKSPANNGKNLQSAVAPAQRKRRSNEASKLLDSIALLQKPEGMRKPIPRVQFDEHQKPIGEISNSSPVVKKSGLSSNKLAGTPLSSSSSSSSSSGVPNAKRASSKPVHDDDASSSTTTPTATKRSSAKRSSAKQIAANNMMDDSMSDLELPPVISVPVSQPRAKRGVGRPKKTTSTVSKEQETSTTTIDTSADHEAEEVVVVPHKKKRSRQAMVKPTIVDHDNDDQNESSIEDDNDILAMDGPIAKRFKQVNDGTDATHITFETMKHEFFCLLKSMQHACEVSELACRNDPSLIDELRRQYLSFGQRFIASAVFSPQ